MPLPLPSSFASAAAGINQDSKKDGGMSGDWTRTRMNGATQTFRRPSVATNLSHNRDSSSQSASTPTPTSAAYIPPHLNSSYQSRNGSSGDSRYSKEDLLSIFKSQRDSGALGKNMGDHFLASWNPLEETSATNGAWGKKEDAKDAPPGPEFCWDHLGHNDPLGLIDMTEEERELFTTTVNSPLKPPPSSASKDNTAVVGGRKASISHSATFNTSSPSSGRPGTRRRETQDSTGIPMSPTAGARFFREEPNTTTPPPSLLRRKTDIRETASNTKQSEEKEKPKELPDISSPFGSLKRSATNPVVGGLAGTSSPWTSASQTANLAPMGAFGSFSIGASSPQTTTSTTDKRPGFGSVRGESRFKGLLSKDSSEDVGMLAKDKGLSKEIDRLAENEGTSRSQSPWNETLKTRAVRSETNPFDEPRSGSAALGGSEEVGSTVDELGFSAFGMTAGVPGLRDLLGRGDGAHDSPSHLQGLEPTSPTNTNPYQSPRGEKVDDDVDTDGSDVQRSQHPGLSGLRDETSAAPFGSIRRGGSALDMSAGDRSQNSSVGPSRGFSNLGGLGGLPSIGGAGAWPSAGAIGTPTRERPAFTGFGDPIFGSVAEMQSPSLSTLGSGGFFGSHGGLGGTGSIGRASKMGSLFPASMQELNQAESARQDAEAKPSASTPSQLPATSAASALPTPLASTAEGAQIPQSSSTGSSNVLPTAQQRTMVMPDRMRWIYRDPQGNIQGPWSGLEMHDWFKAGFFTAELQVKKLEDPEFEPLAQLVRRIGNSREPFLVPQIGIPHGPEPNQATPWTGNTQPGAAQPPFANSFPTFGTTLTAEQQNALERRKQEEQYLMARQKEHLAQQQAMMKQMQLTGGPHTIQPQLQHHSSAHSLQSQPSFGSITSPAAGYQQSPIQGPIQPPQPMPGYFDTPFRQNALPFGPQMLGTDFGSHEELPGFLDRLNVNRTGPFPLNTQGSFSGRQQEAGIHPQQISSILQERARLQQEQEQYDKTHPDSIFEQQARDERLRQFHALRSDEDEQGLRVGEGLLSDPMSTMTQQAETAQEQEEEDSLMQEQEFESSINEPLSLSQQVQKAATAQRQQQQQQHQHQQAQAEAAWAVKGDSGIPHPFPPPPSQSPLPAPAAQRNRQHVADALAATSRSQNQTPVDTPSTSVAPWAKDSNDAPKGPSLKEIQEAEARSAAQREELAAQARRAQLLAEQERLSQAQQATAPGLPSTANWASSASPVTPSATTSVWSKPAAKTSVTPAKTLAQIQKEEEARKQKVTQVNAVQTTVASTGSPVTGKRYADLASKVAASPTSTATGAWMTVGAGGKAKAPPPPAPVGPRSTSATIVVPQVAKPRPVAPVRTSTSGSTPVANPNRANEEFTKWAKITLGKGLNNGINVDDFVQQLLFLPTEAEIISDSVYANSQTLDGRRFAEEFIRRRKLADKGIVDPVSSSAFMDQKTSTGGWSEVAKKSSGQIKQEEDTAAAFKVVAGKKKGKR